MKTVSILLVFLLLLQSCSVYHKTPTTVEAAMAADKKAKVITADNRNYKFKRLEKSNNKLIGITRSGSSTAGKLAGTPAEIDGKYLKFDLSRIDIQEIRLRNDSGLQLLTVVTIAASLAVAYLTVFFISFATADW